MVSRAVIQTPTLSRATRLQPYSSGQALLKLIMHGFWHLFLFDGRGTWLLSEAGDPGGGLQYLILEDWDRYMNDRILVLEPNHSRACTFCLASSHTALCDTCAQMFLVVMRNVLIYQTPPLEKAAKINSPRKSAIPSYYRTHRSCRSSLNCLPQAKKGGSGGM